MRKKLTITVDADVYEGLLFLAAFHSAFFNV